MPKQPKTQKNTIAEILKKKTIGKNDRDTIIKLLDSIISETVNNTSFVYTSFNEQMDKTISEAKGEIETYIQNKMDSLAAKAVATGIKLEDTDFPLKLDEKESK